MIAPVKRVDRGGKGGLTMRKRMAARLLASLGKLLIGPLARRLYRAARSNPLLVSLQRSKRGVRKFTRWTT